MGSHSSRNVSVRFVARSFTLIALIVLFSLITPAVFASSHAKSITNANSQFAPSVYSSSNPVLDGAFGQAVAISGNILVVGAPTETASTFANAGDAYVINTKLGTEITLSSPNAEAGGRFGSSVAISGSTIVVGAPFETVSTQSLAGRVYTFSTAGTLLKTYASPNTQSSGFFGTSVGMSSDDILIGAPGEQASVFTAAGHAYLIDTSTSSVKMISSPSPETSGSFGHSVSIDGNLALIGAYSETAATFSQAGNAYLFSVSSGSLIRTFSSPNAATSGEFGKSVGVSGTTIVVGAPFETPFATTGAGDAYTFDASTGSLLQNVVSPNPATNGAFGASVAISGSTIVVGAPSETSSGVPTGGNAYSFSATSGALILGTFSSPNNQNNGYYGSSVAISRQTIAVGAPGEMASGDSAAGHAYSFLNLPLMLSTPNPTIDGFFGNNVATSGSIIVVGAPQELAATFTHGGHAYIINTATGTVTTLTSPNAQAQGYFGGSVAIYGNTIAVGASSEMVSTFSSAGRVYTFNALTGGLIRTFTSPNAQTNGLFGNSVALSGTTLVAGAYEETVSSLNLAGRVYTFNSATGALIKTLASPNKQASGYFGWAVGISGTTLVVSTPSESVGSVPNAGVAYIFSAKTGSLVHTILSPNAVYSGNFGTSIAISGGIIVVGALFEMVSGAAAGRAYTFSASSGNLLKSFTSPNSQSIGEFGVSVAISGTTVIVGAWLEAASGHYQAGNAYSFSTTSGALNDIFNSPNAQNGGDFGVSVAIRGSTIVVGAEGETGSGVTEAGHAYIV